MFKHLILHALLMGSILLAASNEAKANESMAVVLGTEPNARSQTAAIAMVSGLKLERELSPGDSHVYTVDLENGGAIVAEAYQHGVDLAVDVIGPDGKLIRVLDSPNGAEGPEPIDFTALAAGTYKFVVHTFERNGMPGKYVMTVSEIVGPAENSLRLTKIVCKVPAIFDLFAASQTDPQAFQAFIDDRKSKGPIIDPIPGDASNKLVTFFYLGDQDTVSVSVNGGPGTGHGSAPMARMGRTGFFYVSEIVPNDARFFYGFQVDKVHHAGARGEVDVPETASTPDRMLEMPGAPAQPYVAEKEGVPKGQVTRATVHSKVLNEDRPLTVYTPVGYTNKTPCNLLIVFDGEIYGGVRSSQSRFQTQTILDNMIAAKKIGPTVAVLVWNMGLRERDLTCSKPFADFVGEELVPWVRAHYKISPGTQAVVAAGSSDGGLCSTYCGLTHPEAIGNVISLSGSYWLEKDWRAEQNLSFATPDGTIIQEFRAGKRLPIRFYLEVGRFEGNQVAVNREFRDILMLKGYDVDYQENNGNHQYLHWQGAICDGLIYLLGRTAHN